MKKLDFPYPFSGFRDVDFINCFTCAYMFLENVDLGSTDYQCRKMAGKGCNSCGNCAKGGSTPAWVQEQYFFLFDTMCGRSSLRLAYDGEPTQWQKRIGETEESGCGTDETIEFLFGFAGYNYQKITGGFKAAIAASIEADKPVIARVKTGAGRHRLITGYDGKKLLEPDYKGAQKPPKRPVKVDDIEVLYVVDEKTQPRNTLKDGLERIVQVMEYNVSEGLWDGYIEKLGLYTADSFGKSREEKKARLQRLGETMEYTWNCHNFAEVFRKYREEGNPSIYGGVSDMNRLCDPIFREYFDRISGPCYGYTHDLAWALLGLAQCADWTKHAFSAGYVGEMAELTLVQIKENDEQVLRIIKKILELLQ